MYILCYAPPLTPRWRAVPLALVRASPTFLCLNPEEECPPCVRLCHDVPAVRINLVHPLPPSLLPLPSPFLPFTPSEGLLHLFLPSSSFSFSFFHLFSHPLIPQRLILLSLHLQHSILIPLPTCPSLPFLSSFPILFPLHSYPFLYPLNTLLPPPHCSAPFPCTLPLP